MTKTFQLLVWISVLNFCNAFAQVNLKIGANFGGQVSSLRGLEHESENKFDLVPTTGVNFELGISQSLSVVTAFNFERWKKSREVYSHNGYYQMGPNVVKEGYDFYNIPLLVRYKFGAKKKFFIDGGGFVNYFNKGQPNGFMPLFINFEDYNFGVAMGAGTIFYLNDFLDITLQVRNDFGLSQMNKYENQIAGNVKTNTLRMIATLNFKVL